MIPQNVLTRAMAITMAFTFGASAYTPDSPEQPPAQEKASPQEQVAEAPRQVPKDRAALEREFTEMLTGATLRGVWQMTGEGGLTGREPLTDPKPESYHIVSASKVSEAYWLIAARVEVGDKNVTVPVPVRVEWAGDTPVITLDDVPIPMLGTYSARVMVHRGFYSGTWLSNAKNYGGVMAGRVIKENHAEAAQAPADSSTDSAAPSQRR